MQVVSFALRAFQNGFFWHVVLEPSQPKHSSFRPVAQLSSAGEILISRHVDNDFPSGPGREGAPAANRTLVLHQRWAVYDCCKCRWVRTFHY